MRKQMKTAMAVLVALVMSMGFAEAIDPPEWVLRYKVQESYTSNVTQVPQGFAYQAVYCEAWYDEGGIPEYTVNQGWTAAVGAPQRVFLRGWGKAFHDGDLAFCPDGIYEDYVEQVVDLVVVNDIPYILYSGDEDVQVDFWTFLPERNIYLDVGWVGKSLYLTADVDHELFPWTYVENLNISQTFVAVNADTGEEYSP